MIFTYIAYCLSGVRILLYLGSFCIYGWEMKDYETDHSNRKT